MKLEDASRLPGYEEIGDWSKYVTDHNKYIVGQYVEIPKQYKKQFLNNVSVGKSDTEIVFEDCVFECHVSLNDLFAPKGIHFKNCIIKGCLSTTVKTKIEGNFLIEDSTVDFFDFFGGQYEFCIWDFRYADFVRLRFSTFTQLIIGNDRNSQIRQLILNCSLLKGDITITGNLLINYLSLSETLNSCMRLQNATVSVVDFYRFVNNGELRIGNITAAPLNSKLFLTESNLGSAEFYNVDFDAFSVVNIYHSQVLDCRFNDVRWRKTFSSGPVFKRIAVDSRNAIEKNLEDLQLTAGNYRNNSNLREVYRQLKNSLSKQGDTVHEQHFHTMEMRSYLKSLTGWRTWGTQFIIWCSFRFSNFGQTFVWPLIWLFVGHLILFFIAVGSNAIPSLHLSFLKPSIQGFNVGLYEYFLLLNPAHQLGDRFYGWQIVVDVLMRVWNSYMIYNIIRASRRFLK